MYIVSFTVLCPILLSRAHERSRGGRQRNERWLVRVFAQLRNADRAQHVQNTFVDAAQRLLDRTPLRGIAIPVARHARSDQHGTVNGRNNVQRADLRWVLRQLVTAAGAVFRDDQKAMREFLQHLSHEGRGDAVLLGDLVGAASVLLAMHSKVLDGYQSVVGLFGKLEHRSRDLLDSLGYATESVAHEVYP